MRPFLQIICLLIICLLILASGAEAKQQTFKVDNAEEVEALIESGTLAAGDTILWADGNFNDVNLDIEGVDGTENQPILLRSATPGAVVLSGESQFKIGAKWWVIQGFHFNGSPSSFNGYNTFQFRSNSGNPSQHVRLTDCAFTNLTTEDETSKWILLYGQSNSIDHCHFSGKNKKGALIIVELGYLDDDETAGHLISNNYFGDVAFQQGSDNETIRIGSSADQNKRAQCVVRENLFVRCNGENEIISSKSSYNVFEKNTFRQCNGALVLRHGHHAHVEGNFFFGDGANNSGGIRVVDSHHTIINNYLYDLTGLTWNAAFSIVGGSQKSGETTNGYQAVDDIFVAHNSIIHCKTSFFLNKKKGSRGPTGTIANNLIVSSGDPLITGGLPIVGLAWMGNLLHGGKVSVDLKAISDDPKLSMIDGLLRPDPKGPAANAAVQCGGKVVKDIDRQMRPESNKDIGADEVSGAIGTISSTPLIPTDVGVSYLNGDMPKE